MNIKIDRELLLTPLGNVSGIVEKRHALPILSNLLIEGQQGSLRFTATDLEMQISTHIKTELSEDFQITISAKKLFDITRALPESSKIDIQIAETKVTVKAKKSRFKSGFFFAPTFLENAAPEFFCIFIILQGYFLAISTESLLLPSDTAITSNFLYCDLKTAFRHFSNAKREKYRLLSISSLSLK